MVKENGVYIMEVEYLTQACTINVTVSRNGVDYAVRPDETKIDVVNVVGDWSTVDSGVVCGTCGVCPLEDDLGDFGQRKPLKMMDPKLPSQAEVDEHYLTHLPFRSWCKHCVRGRGRAADHRTQERDDGLPELHVDCCFLSSAASPEKYTVMVAREKMSRMTMATLVPMKGASQEFPVRRLLSFIKELGAEGSAVALKSDQEPAIVDLNEVTKRRQAKTFPEHSPVYSSQSNGVAERAVQPVEGQVRTMKDALESRLGVGAVTVPRDGDSSSLVAWLVEYAAVLLNRYEVGHDGKTASERLRGKRSKVLGLEFGEKILWRRVIKGDRSVKLDTVWEDGVYVGHRTCSGDSMVASTKGMYRTRTIRRVPQEDRWNTANLDVFKYFPWKVNDSMDAGEQVVSDAQPVPPSMQPTAAPELPDVTVRQEAPRRMYVKLADLQKHGYIAGCSGCKALEQGGPRTGHNEACRSRISQLLSSMPEGQKRVYEARRREDMYLAEQVRKTEEERKAKMPRIEEGGGPMDCCYKRRSGCVEF